MCTINCATASFIVTYAECDRATAAGTGRRVRTPALRVRIPLVTLFSTLKRSHSNDLLTVIGGITLSTLFLPRVHILSGMT